MRVLALSMLCAAAVGVGGQASAQEEMETAAQPEYALDDHFLRSTRAGSSTVLDLGCVGRSLLRTETKLFVACGPAGVVEIDLSDPLAPRIDGTMPVEGSATDLFLRDGHPWVETAHVDARPVRISPRGLIAPGAFAVPAIRSWLPPPVELAKEQPSIVAPPRHGGIWELSFLSSAFVAFGSIGVGQLGSASITHRFELPIVVRAEIAPFGVAGPATRTSCCSQNVGQTSSNGGAVTVFGANLLFGLDTQFVEVGLGFGGATINNNSNTAPLSGGGSSGPPATGSVSIVEEARIGARDGLAVNLESSAIALNSQFALGYFTMSVQIPVAQKTMLIVRGGGGIVGFGYGDLGVRVFVRGDGGKGTVGLTGFAGGAMVQENLCSSNSDPPFTTVCNAATLAGPSLGGGVEWRP